jgi:hypothetical protein
MAKKVTLTIDPGMWSNLTEEFRTDDPYQLITELHEARSMLLAENADLRVLCDATRTERNALSAQLIALRRDRDEVVAELEFDLDAARAERDAIRTEAQDMMHIAYDLREERDAARAEVDDVYGLLDRLQESAAGLGEAAGVAAAERDAAQRELDIATTRVGMLTDENAYLRKDHAHLVNTTSRLIRANLRLKRACLGWWQAAHEAQTAALRYRDADVSALVVAATWARDAVEAYHVLGMMDRPSDTELLGVLRAALRPFARVPVVGELSSETTPEDWKAFRQRIGAEVGSDE